VVLLRKDGGVPPVRRTTGDNDAELTLKISRSTSILAGHLAKAHFHLFVRWRLVAELFKPRRTG
jgi:hypothetical protein